MFKSKVLAVFVGCVMLPGVAFASKHHHRYRQHHHYSNNTEFGGSHILATYYGNELRRHRTANGEMFNPGGLTCAHRSFPFGTRLRVFNPLNNRAIVVRVNDRGPFRPGYSLDLAQGAARMIGFSSGLLHMTVLH